MTSNRYDLRLITQQTYTDCLNAVREDGMQLQFVENRHKTPDICLIAVTQNGLALQFVENRHKTPEVCLAAVTQNGLALQFVSVQNQTVRVCIAAVTQNPLASQYVIDQTNHLSYERVPNYSDVSENIIETQRPNTLKKIEEKSEDEDSKEEIECCVCYDKNCKTATPCNHILCITCYNSLTRKTCPICRAVI